MNEARRHTVGLGSAAMLLPLLAPCCATPEPAGPDPLRALETRRPAEPVRRTATDPGRQVVPLPDGRGPAARSPLTARFETTIPGQTRPSTIVFTRLGDRVGIRDTLRATEWQFVRNPVEPTQLTASRVDHGLRQIVFYSYPDLLDADLPTDWHQLAACGVDPEFLTSLEPRDETRTEFGIEFQRYVARPDSTPAHLPVELFWNAEHDVPLLVVYRTERGEMRQQLVSLKFETSDETRLLLAQRFRPYDRTTVAAFREQHEQCPLVRTPR